MTSESARRRGRKPAKSLAFADWSAADKAAWEAGFPQSALRRARVRQGVLARRPAARLPRNTPKTLSSATLDNQQAALERYFGFLKRRHPELLQKPLASRFARELIEDFTRDFAPTVKPQSIKDYLDWLRLSLETLAPMVDGEIPRRIALAIPNRTHKTRKPPPIVHATTLLRSALADMDKLMPQILALAHEPCARAFARAPRLLYRNALIVAIGVADPLRAKNLVGLSLYETFKIIESVGFEIAIPREQMKTRKRPHRRKLPKTLNKYVRFYLDFVRPTFLADGQGTNNRGPLWLTWRGARLGGSTFHDIVKQTTRRLVGERLGPHALRRLFADLVARLGLPLALAKRGLDHAPGSGETDHTYTSVRRRAGQRLLGALTAKELSRAALGDK
jgi:hypothetical protein